MDKTIVDGHMTLFYREEGSGIPVILLHGFAEDNAIWGSQIDQISAGYRVLAPDWPGSGRSSALSGETSMESLADAVRLLLDRLSIDQCVLIGHSMGGYATLAFAEKYSERLKGFGLFHSTAYPDSEEKKAARRKSIEFIRSHGSAAFIRQSVPNLFAESTRSGHPELINDTLLRYSGFSPESLISYYEAMIRRPDRTHVLAQAKVPVLFVIGEHDQAVPPQQALQQSHLPSLSHIHVLTSSGHMGMQEEPSRSNQILQSFLNFVINS